MTLPIILASGSAIRHQILTDADVPHSVRTKTIDEDALKSGLLAEGHSPRNVADALAEAKSLAVSRNTPGLVIGADQVMVMAENGTEQMFDKPRDRDDARERLRAMSGREHQLIGATVVSEDGRPVWRNLATTRLYVRELSDAFIEDYLNAEGDLVTQSVGAYRFEGRGAQLFTRVEGDFFAILGLDLLPLLDYLRLRGAMPA